MISVSEVIFLAIVFIIILNYTFERYLSWVNSKHSSSSLPDELKGYYNEEEYKKQREYDNSREKLSLVSSTLNFVIILLMLLCDGFVFVDKLSHSITETPLFLPIVFFSILTMASGVINLPFSLYGTFVVEEKFGFNRTSAKTFIVDRLKGAVVMVIFGGGLMILFTWFYYYVGDLFWLWAWGAFSVVMVLLTAFYASLFVPLFNKLTPLEEGPLRKEIVKYCSQVNFKLDNLFVMDGSKRSSKANAFFSGLGARKRIVLYDTLIKGYSKEEITSVLAHEIGHYKKKHTLVSLIISIVQVGITLFVLSLFIQIPDFSKSIGMTQPGLHMSLLVFSLLYSPFSLIISIVMNILSRKNEFEADNYAKTTYDSKALISALKKLSVESLSNLNPHPIYVFVNYSHPTLFQRIRALSN